LATLATDLRLAVTGREAWSAEGGRTDPLACSVLIVAIGRASFTCRIGEPELRAAEIFRRCLRELRQGKADDQGHNKFHTWSLLFAEWSAVTAQSILSPN
jgi:hypothetical protein